MLGVDIVLGEHKRISADQSIRLQILYSWQHPCCSVVSQRLTSCLMRANVTKPHCFLLFLLSCKRICGDGGRTSSSVEKSQLGLLGHLVRPPPGRLPQQEFLAHPARKWPRGPPRRFYLCPAWQHLGSLRSE